MPYRRQKGMIIMIKQAISAFAAAAVAVSFASAAFAADASVVEKIPVTDFTLTDTGNHGAKIDGDNQQIVLTYTSKKPDGGDYTAESYLKYIAPADGKVTITFNVDRTKTEYGTTSNNKPRLYWSLDNGDKPYNKNKITTSTGGYTQATTAELSNIFKMDVTAGTTYYIYGWSWFADNKYSTYTLTDFKFTSTADITAATKYNPIEYRGTDKGFTAELTGSEAGTINWYAKSSSAEAYSKIGSVSTVLTGEDSTTFTAGLVISGMGDEVSNYNIGASIN